MQQVPFHVPSSSGHETVLESPSGPRITVTLFFALFWFVVAAWVYTRLPLDFFTGGEPTRSIFAGLIALVGVFFICRIPTLEAHRFRIDHTALFTKSYARSATIPWDIIQSCRIVGIVRTPSTAFRMARAQLDSRRMMLELQLKFVDSRDVESRFPVMRSNRINSEVEDGYTHRIGMRTAPLPYESAPTLAPHYARIMRSVAPDSFRGVVFRRTPWFFGRGLSNGPAG